MEDAERVEGAGAAADVADAADAADVAGAPDAPPPGPFERLRTRTVVPFWIVGVVVLVAAFHLVARFLPLDAGEEQTFELVFGFAAYIAVGLWIVWACRRWGVGLARLVGALPEGHGWLAWGRLGLLLALTMAFSYGSWVLFANLLVGVAPWLLEFYIEALWVESDPGAGYRLGMAVTAVVLAPVFEEAFFRGVLVNRWGVRWGLPAAVVVSSVAFGVLHANPLGIGIVGVVAALLYLQTRTLIVPIAFHAANNLVATVWSYQSGDSGPLDLAAELQEVRADMLLGVVLVAVSVPVLGWYIRRNWPGRDDAIPYAGRG